MEKKGTILLVITAILFIATLGIDRFYLTGFKQQFNALEKERIVTANRLATAKIVYENLNHVRDLVFKNMEFPRQKDSAGPEAAYFDFITDCANDLKLKIISFAPTQPVVNGRITSSGYDLEVEGDFFKFGELCAKVENSRRLMAIESFKVEPSDSAASGDRSHQGIKASMRIMTYRGRKGIGA